MAKVTIAGRSYEVEVRDQAVVVDGQEFPIKLRDDGAYQTVTAGGVGYRVQLPPEDQRQSGMTVQVDYRALVVEWEGRLESGPAPRTPASARSAAPAPKPGVKGGVAAQIAGKILRVHVKAGDAVEQGQVLIILEAMKMENEIKAPATGTVKEVPVVEGQRVVEGDTLVVVE